MDPPGSNLAISRSPLSHGASCQNLDQVDQPVLRTFVVPSAHQTSADGRTGWFKSLQYVRRLSEPVPRNARGDAASRAACALCATMGDTFEEEVERSAEFNRCVRAVFRAWQREYLLSPTNECSARVDFALSSHLDTWAPYPCLIREDKLEPGSAGDPYMQCVRDYQILIQLLKENGQEKWLALGAPTLLVSLAGMYRRF